MIVRIKQKSKKDFFSARSFKIAIILIMVLSSALHCSANTVQEKLVLEAKEAIESADAFMGDWQGSWTMAEGTGAGSAPIFAQVIALGKKRYLLNLLNRLDARIEPMAVPEGLQKGEEVRFADHVQREGADFNIEARIKDDILTGTFKGRNAEGDYVSVKFILEKTFRISPTLGKKPPTGAIVLFDGTGFEQWEHAGLKKPKRKKVRWKLVNGAMQVVPESGSVVTKRKFKDFELHLEFRTPYMPEARAQKRGNSGVYLQGRYELQVLDSYGLEGRDNECGGIYKVGAPKVNMCAPPTQWQSYDIVFRAPRFEGGKKIKNAIVTAVHNGVTIHDNLEIPKPTAEALDNNVDEPGGIYLQDHDDPVEYRNIWLVELPAE